MALPRTRCSLRRIDSLGNSLDSGIHETLLAGRDDDDPALGHCVAAAILSRIVTDDGSPWHDHIAIQDGPPDATRSVHDDVRQEDAVLDVAIGVDANIGAENGMRHPSP